MTEPANLADKLATFDERFSPRTIATYNNNDIMVAIQEPAAARRRCWTPNRLLPFNGQGRYMNLPARAYRVEPAPGLTIV